MAAFYCLRPGLSIFPSAPGNPARGAEAYFDNR